MSEVTTPASTPESPPGYELVPNPDGEESADGSEETGLFAGGNSPGLDAESPEQQVEAPPTEQVETPEQQATEPTQQQIPAKEDESRYEYWQSQAGKVKKELDEIKGGQLHAIARYIQQNPEMLDVVEGGMRGGPTKGTPEKPVRPQRPSNYDSSEAHDPETASGRFWIDHNEYLAKKDVYNDAREDQAEIQAERNAGKAQVAELRSGLIREGGLNEFEADEFLTLLQDPQSRDPATLAKFYRVLKAPSQDSIANQEKAKKLLAQQTGLEAPPPLTVAGGESPPKTTPEDDFHTAMRAGAELGGSLL